MKDRDIFGKGTGLLSAICGMNMWQEVSRMRTLWIVTQRKLSKPWQVNILLVFPKAPYAVPHLPIFSLSSLCEPLFTGGGDPAAPWHSEGWGFSLVLIFTFQVLVGLGGGCSRVTHNRLLFVKRRLRHEKTQI